MGSQVRSTVIGVIAGFASVIIKNNVVPPNVTGIANIAIYSMFAVVALLLVLFTQIIITFSYQKFPGFRFFFDTVILRQSFFEGFWVDVGIDDPGIHPQRIVNCSFITIIRTNDVYTLEGISWNIHGRDWWTWRSYWAKLADRKLTFWYEATKSGSRKKIDAKAEIQYMDLGAKEPAMYEGRYDDDYFHTVAERLSDESFRVTRAKTFNEKRSRALEFLNAYKNREGFDDEYVRIYDPGVQEAMDLYRQWYLTFLRYSDNKTAEMETLKKSTRVLTNKSFDAILDVGPGEGSITVAFLEMLKSHGLLRQTAKYIWLEPSGSYLQQLSIRLEPILKGFGDFRLTKIEDFLRQGSRQDLDLILACNCLYFVKDLKDVCLQLINNLGRNGVLIALHTDFAREPFLDQLVTSANDEVNRDVVQTLADFVDRGTLSLLASESGSVRVAFPGIDDEHWKAIERGMTTSENRVIQDVVNLVCFLVNKDAKKLQETNQWSAIVRRVSDKLEANRNCVDLPIQLQVLEKA